VNIKVADVICIVEIVDSSEYQSSRRNLYSRDSGLHSVNNVADVICIVEIVDSSEYQCSRRNLYSRNSGR